jgi:protein-arginine kinase activator protein McsA
MICDICKTNTATVYLTQIDGNMNLCKGCSKDKGVPEATGFPLADLLLHSRHGAARNDMTGRG